MNTFTDRGIEFFQWVLQTSWQAAVLAGLILLAQGLFRKRLSPAWRYGLWLLLVTRLLMPVSPQSAFSVFNVAKLAPTLPGVEAAPAQLAAPRAESQPAAEATLASETLALQEPAMEAPAELPIVPFAHEFTSERLVESSAAAVVHPGTSQKTSADWLKVTFGLWLAGAVLLGLRLASTNLRFRSRIRGHVPSRDRRALQVLDEARAALGVRQRIALIETDCVATPAVYGLWRKRLLLPDGFVHRFSDEELRHIFLHELAHLKRRDLEVNWFVALLQALHWFNPMLWLAFRRMHADRELATDALALSCIHEKETTPYGETILKVVEGLARRPAMPGLVGIAEDKAQIAQRLRAIARHGAVKPWRWIALVSVVAIAALALTDAKEEAQPQSESQIAAGSAATPSLGMADADRPGQEGRKRFELHVADYDTTRLLSGVTVKFEMEYYGRNPEAHERVTGDDGKVAIEFETTDLKRFAYRVQRSDYVAPRGEWLKHQTALIPAEFEIRASPGVEIGGTVIDDAGRPVAGAEVFFDRPLNMILSESDYPVHSRKWTASAGERLATTDAAGVWRAKCIYPSIQWAALRIRHRNFADAVFSTEITKAMEAKSKGHTLQFEDLVQQRAQFSLSPGVTVKGGVVYEAGMPAAGVQVRYADRRSENPFWDQIMGKGTTTTDANGTFLIAHLPAKTIFFTVQEEGYAPAVAELDLNSAAPELELRLKRGQKLLGHVVDNKTGQPVSGARLTFLDWSIWQSVKWEAVTDEDGRFEWADAPAERFRVRVEKDGYIPQEKSFQSDGEQAVRLNPVLKLNGKVMDAATQEPVEHFCIFWADRDDRLRDLRRFGFEGSNGVYLLEVGKLQSDLWGGGYAQEFLVKIETDGYLSATSRVFSARQGDVGEMVHDFKLKAAKQNAVMVTDREGKPVARAAIALKTPDVRLYLAGKPQFEKLDPKLLPVTDEQGRCLVTLDPEASHLIAVHERGIAWIETTNLALNPKIELQPWGRVEGTAWEYDKLVPNQEVWLTFRDDLRWIDDFSTFKSKTDDHGRFSIDFVPPTKCSVYRMIPRRHGGAGGLAERVQVKPGETISVKLGGVGRPVIGRMKIKNPYVEIEWQKNHYSAHTAFPRRPEDLKSPEEFEAWRRREDIQRAFDQVRHYSFQFSDDGSFRMDEARPGKYEFFIQIHDPRDPDAFAYSRYIAKVSGTFEVPDTPQRNSREPFDIGEFELSLKPQIDEGKTAAPEFTALNMDGKEFELSNFKGKYVLLDFWATWCGPCLAEMPYLREAHKKFGAREDFVMISLSLDDAIEKPREFAKKNDMPWKQGYLGQSDTVGKYGAERIPAIFLINPEGKIIAKDLRGGAVSATLGKWLK